MAKIYEVVDFGPLWLRGFLVDGNDTRGPKLAHQTLGELISGQIVTVTYGVVTPDAYFAGVEEDVLPTLPELLSAEIPAGPYAKQKLNHWLRRTHRIASALDTLGANALHMRLGNDFIRPEVEIYHHQFSPNDPDHLDLLFPIRRRRAQNFQL